MLISDIKDIDNDSTDVHSSHVMYDARIYEEMFIDLVMRDHVFFCSNTAPTDSSGTE